MMLGIGLFCGFIHILTTCRLLFRTVNRYERLNWWSAPWDGGGGELVISDTTLASSPQKEISRMGELPPPPQLPQSCPRHRSRRPIAAYPWGADRRFLCDGSRMLADAATHPKHTV